MKIGLVFPNYLETFLFAPSSSHQPLGLSMIAAQLKKRGDQVRVFDATADQLNIYRLTKLMKKFGPDIIGITANVSFGWKALLTAKWLKRNFPRVKIIFGGPWPTTEFRTILQNNAADFVVVGEGEYTIIDLLDTIENGGNLEDVKGIAFKKDNDIIQTEHRALIEDLNALPFPAWEFFPRPTKYYIGFKGSRHFPIMTSRGCPFNCINCSKFIHGYKIRKRTIENVIEEIRYLKHNFKANEIVFIDDGFNYDIERAESLFDEIANLEFKVHIRCPSIRADRVTPRLALKMKRAGVYDVAVGVESGTQEIVDKIGKKLDLKKVKQTIKLFKKLGILTTAFFMVGLPDENFHTIVNTKKFIMDLGVDMADVFKITPIPGTKLYELIELKGKIDQEQQKHMQFFSYQNQTFELDNLPKEIIQYAIQDINRSFYLRLSKILYFLKHLNLRNWKWYLNAFFLIIMRVFGNQREIKPEEISDILKK